RGIRSGLMVGIAGALIVGIFSGLLLFAVGHDTSYALNRGLSFGIVGGLASGLMIGGLFSTLIQTRCEQEMTQNAPKIGYSTRMADGLIIGLCGWVGCTVVTSAIVDLQDGVFYGAISSLVVSIIYGFGGSTGLIRNLGMEIQPTEVVSWDTANMLRDL